MNFEYSARCKEYLQRVRAFMDEHVYPNEKTYHDQLAGFGTNRWQVLPIIEELKAKAKAQGLWNLFHPDDKHGAGLFQRGLCTAGRGNGPGGLGERSVQLLRARYRKHGGALALTPRKSIRTAG